MIDIFGCACEVAGAAEAPQAVVRTPAVARTPTRAPQIARVPLNEDCWLGINGVTRASGGAAYRQAIVRYVKLLHRYGMYVELSLIWAAPGKNKATYQPGSPDEDHAPKMWASLART